MCSIDTVATPEYPKKYAWDFTTNGVFYRIIDESNHYVAVTYDCKVINTYSGDHKYCGYSGSVTIPSTVKNSSTGITYTVIEIDAGAFSGDAKIVDSGEPTTEITSVTFPSTIRKIGIGAFSGCINLTSVYNLGTSSVSEIGDNAFNGCTKLSSISLPSTLTTIGASAFRGCSKISSLALPSSVKSIGASAFYGCSGLTSISIPNNVTSIAESTFYACSNLSSITIPSTVTSIGTNAFTSTSWYKNQGEGLVILSNCLLGYKGTVPSSLSIPSGIRLIADGALSNENLITSLSIPSTVVYFGKSAFCDCQGLTTITSNITTPSSCVYGSYVFYGCSSSCKLRVPAGKTSTYRSVSAWSKFTNNIVEQYVSSVSFDKPTESVQVGKTLTLTPTVLAENAENKSLTWSSTNTDVATVSSSGVVTAKAVGTTTIKAEATDGSGKYATCTVTVTPVYVSSISLNQSSQTLYTGGTVTLTATISPTNATNKSVKWSSSNAGIASVSSAGVVTANKAGTATITATAADGSGKTATCTITVKQKATSISLNKPHNPKKLTWRKKSRGNRRRKHQI